MRIWILSDLHLEIAPMSLIAPEAIDVIVIAGDLHSPGPAGAQWLVQQPISQQYDVIYVPGDHKFHRSVY